MMSGIDFIMTCVAILVILVMACIAVWLIVAILSIVMMMFMERVRILQERGDTKRAYRLAQKILKVARLMHVRIPPLNWFVPVLLLQTSQLAEAIGDTDAAIDWAKQVSAGKFSTDYRVTALQHQATWLRKQSRVAEAQSLEAEALELSRLSEVAKKRDSTESALTEIARNTILISQGHFREALENIERAWLDASDMRRIGLAAQKAIVLRGLGRYDEALSAQYDMETRYRRLTNPYPDSRPITRALHEMHQSSTMASQMTRIHLCLEAGKIGSAGEIWDALPAEVVNDHTEALRYATGAWLFAARGDTETARRLIAEQPAENDPERQAALHGLLGRALLALCDYNTAANHFQSALAGCAGKPLAEAEFRALLANCYVRQEKYDLARAEYEAVIAAGFEEAAFTREAREQLARLQANDVADREQVRLGVVGGFTHR